MSDTLTRKDFVEVLAKKHDLPKSRVDALGVDLLEDVTKALKKGNKVALSQFGIFEVKKRPALSRLKAVLDRVRQQFPASLTAEAQLQRMSMSYLVGHYAVHDESGAVVCQWHNPELRGLVPAQRATG